MSNAFAGTGDLAAGKIGFDKLADGVHACIAEGAPDTGVIVGDDGVMVIDIQATLRDFDTFDKTRVPQEKPTRTQIFRSTVSDRMYRRCRF